MAVDTGGGGTSHRESAAGGGAGTGSEGQSQGKASSNVSDRGLEDRRADGESDYLRVIEDQKEKMQYMQAQLELLTGTTDQIDMAAEACCAIEG